MKESLPPLSRAVAVKIAKRYATTTSEKGYAQSFWRDIFSELCRVDTFALLKFEHAVTSAVDKSTKWIDAFWPGVVLIEHKSRGRNLDEAEQQAREYLVHLQPVDRPQFIIVSDFARIRIVNILTNDRSEFPLESLADESGRLLAIIQGHIRDATREEESADAVAANLMGSLFKTFEEAGYSGHETSVFLVRILFLLFAEDTRLLRSDGFTELVRSSQDDGSGLGTALEELFTVLNSPIDERPATLSSRLKEFPYVNGELFSEPISTFNFTGEMREALLTASAYDWSGISPAIFGSLFQAARDAKTRREMGEHYTSSTNIRRVISNLFLNEFRERFLALRDNPIGLSAFREELAGYRWLDPAGGSGNFLIVAYQEMRDLEHDIIRRLQDLSGGKTQLKFDGTTGLQVRLGQFHGIEIDEWSSAIARVGMFLAEHQANLRLEEITGSAPNQLPLRESANIVTDDALEIDWAAVCPMTDKTFIMGNPPFLGARLQSTHQKAQTERVWSDTKSAGSLDYVANWIRIASEHAARSGVRAAFVASKSITQGEQPPIIWSHLHSIGIGLDFAHRSFKWSNGSKDEAGVHVVILGISAFAQSRKGTLWRQSEGSDEFVSTEVENISPYLTAGPSILVARRSSPLSAHVPKVRYGSQPNDAGHLSNIEPEEAARIRATDPVAASFLRRIIGARELIHDEERWCLWLTTASPAEIRRSPELRRRLELVRNHRLASKRAATRDLANTPGLFGFISHPDSDYIAIPRHSSAEREYIPFAYFPAEIITTDALSLIPDAPKWLFAVISSRPVVVWSHAVSGRIGEGIRISGGVTYNNFPFPAPSDTLQARLAESAQEILDARARYPDSSLADLYEGVSTPEPLRKAHRRLDEVMVAEYGCRITDSDDDLLQAIFERYVESTGSDPR